MMPDKSVGRTRTMTRQRLILIGALLYLLEAATLYGGAFYRVNPLDQPGVEEGKKATYALMGRKGYEAKRVEMEKYYERAKGKELVVRI